MTQPPIATDPVCGMDVDSSAARLTSQHHGQTVVFCSPGCKQAFDRNPDKYLDGNYKPSMLGVVLGRVRDLFWDKRP